MLKLTIRVLSKQHPGIKMICIKPRARSTAIMKDITRLLPNLKHIFMYRNPLGTIISRLRMMYCEPFPAVLCSFALYSEWLSKICPYFRHLLQYYFISRLRFSRSARRCKSRRCVCLHVGIHYTYRT